jgi:Adenylate and Guanylate cyclase catalytic domain
MSVSRRLVAVFAADVEGYSRLMAADEVGTLKGLTERRAILDRIIGEHSGRIANTAGDSVLAEFGSAADAVQCAVDAQTALAEANSGQASDRRICFRIGIHIGDVMVRAGDLFGDGVNIAARLQSIAKPGAVASRPPSPISAVMVRPVRWRRICLSSIPPLQCQRGSLGAEDANDTRPGGGTMKNHGDLLFPCGWIGLLPTWSSLLQSRSGGRFGLGDRDGSALDRWFEVRLGFSARPPIWTGPSAI